MLSRREFLGAGAALAAPGFLEQDRPTVISDRDLSFLKDLATATITSATKTETVPARGFAFITPGGNYPSLWIRDFSMAAGCGLIGPETLHEHLLEIARAQNGPSERNLGPRAMIPAWAVPDHIRYDGGAVFYPGTYSAGDDQGGEPYGVLPPVDDHYEIVHIAHCLMRATNKRGFLDEEIAGIRLIDRLSSALAAPHTDPNTGLVTTEAGARAVGFGFCDGVYLTGKLLFASLLRYRALAEFAEMARGIVSPGFLAEVWRQIALIRAHISPTFAHEGWLLAATGVGRQPDVWGTAYALHLGALTGRARRDAEAALVEAIRRGTISYDGAIRHVPTDHDFSKQSAWEQTAGIPKNRYQNGAYWHVPTGWVVSAIAHAEPGLARKIVGDMVAHFRKGDFRKGGGSGAPWECFHPGGDYHQNPVYMASVTLPLEVLQHLKSGESK